MDIEVEEAGHSMTLRRGCRLYDDNFATCLAANSSILPMCFPMTGRITTAVVCVRSFVNATVQRRHY
jgi:hypothetical protein